MGGYSYAVRKLSRDRPDLLERVKAGELSAHKAMVEAGFRKVKTPLEQVKSLCGKLSAGERQALQGWLRQQP